MKVITPGHKYELENFEKKDQPGQVIQFIEKQKGDGDKLVTVNDGTTNEELLAVLLDRMKHLSKKLPDRFNDAAIGGLTTVLEMLKRRTKDRQERGVEGTSKE